MKSSNDIMALVVKQLADIRKEKGLSHETVATHAGIHRTTISLIESGKNQPTLLTLLKITQALECDLGAIISKSQK